VPVACYVARVELKQLFEVFAPQPRATLPLGLRVNGHVYAGNLTGADPVSGAIEPEPMLQLMNALQLLRHAVERAGGGLQHLRRVVATVADPADGEAVEITLGDSLRGAEIETDVAPLPPGQLVRLDAFAALDDGNDRPALVYAGEAPAGVRMGDVVWSAAITAADPETGKVRGDTEAQMRGAFESLDRLLAEAGLDRGAVLRIGGYLRDLGEKDVLNAAMVEAFPDASRKPVHKYVPAALPTGVNVALQVLARSGVEREIIEIEGIKHNDPISLGAKAGNLVVSSRVQGRLMQDAEAQAERLVESHARTVLQHVGGELRHVTQTLWGVGDAAYGDDIARVMARHWPEGLPDVQVVEADFPHSGLPRLEFTALLD
jgi:enamine deaminase RidA (YjgF/YER057c/UK114 family)